MPDLDEGPHAGPRRLAAVPDRRATPFVTGAGASPAREPPPARPAAGSEASDSVVPADRLLDTAGSLAEGAAALHAQLRHLDPAQRDAVLDVVADHLHALVRSWTELVRAMVPRQGAIHAGGGSGADAAPDAVSLPGEQERRPVSVHHPARVQRLDDDTAGAPRDAAHGAPPSPPRAAVRSLPPPDDDPPSVPHRDRDGGDGERPTRDELTGVLNRTAGLAALEREIDRCRRGGERFVLGYLNVDGMTLINDARGLRAGDEVLRKVTAALRATLRSYDVIARLGGDEFLFSVPGADAVTAELRVKEFSVILAEDSPGTSASVGFAELHLHDSLDELVAQAETAMLKGRRQRRRGRR
jgi:diguanylate cyclase (GGDEF)-like protein